MDQLVFSTKRKQKHKSFAVTKKCRVSDNVKDIEFNDVLLKDEQHFETPISGVKVPSDSCDTSVPSGDVSTDTAVSEVGICVDQNSSLETEKHELGSVSKLKVSTDQRIKLTREKEKISLAVAKLTIDADKGIDHRDALEQAAIKLNNARLSKSKEVLDVDSFKNATKGCRNGDEISKIIWKNCYFQERFSHLFTSKLLEELVSLGSLVNNPLKQFPVDINRNIYADIMNFAMENAEDVMLLLTFLTKKYENPIGVKEVIQLAYLFSALAEASC